MRASEASIPDSIVGNKVPDASQIKLVLFKKEQILELKVILCPFTLGDFSFLHESCKLRAVLCCFVPSNCPVTASELI